MFDLSTTINSLSRSSIYFSYWIISLFILSMFCYLNLNCSFLSCYCFFKHCFKKQKSHDLSLFILFLEHYPHTDTAQIRLIYIKILPMMSVYVSLRIERLFTNITHLSICKLLLSFHFNTRNIFNIGCWNKLWNYLIGYVLVLP